MDLSQFDTVARADGGIPVHLRHPGTDAPLFDDATGEPVTITVIGSDSKRYTEVARALTTKRLNKRLGRRPKVSAEEIEADNLELAVAATTGWKHIVLDGQVLTFSEANTRKLYTRLPWTREQVEDAINDRSNYLGESSKTS